MRKLETVLKQEKPDLVIFTHDSEWIEHISPACERSIGHTELRNMQARYLETMDRLKIPFLEVSKDSFSATSICLYDKIRLAFVFYTPVLVNSKFKYTYPFFHFFPEQTDEFFPDDNDTRREWLLSRDQPEILLDSPKYLLVNEQSIREVKVDQKYYNSARYNKWAAQKLNKRERSDTVYKEHKTHWVKWNFKPFVKKFEKMKNLIVI